MGLISVFKNGFYKVSIFIAICFLCSFCSPAPESVKPDTNYLKNYLGTFSGFLFPNESLIIQSVTMKRAFAFYGKDGIVYNFYFDYSHGIYDTTGFYKTEIQYYKIVGLDSLSSSFKGGKKDYDTLQSGLQNLKLSKTSVFGSNISIQFSGIINDTLPIDRSFQKK